METAKGIDFRNGDIRTLFFRMLGPTLAGMVFSVVFILTDGIFVGHGIGSHALAAINLVQPVYTLATAIGMMFAVGASVTAAIMLSRGNENAARTVVTQAYIAVLCLALVLGIFLVGFPDRILRLLGTSDALMAMTKDYYVWFLPSVLFIMVQLLGMFIIRQDGSPKFAGMVEIVPACVNIFLDWLFIFPLQKGLAGAAAATSIGGLCGLLMVVYYMLFRCRSLKIRMQEWRDGIFRHWRQMSKLGASAFVGDLAISALMLSGNYAFMKMLGEDGVAAFSVTCYLIPMIFMFCMAISQSAQPIISFNFGAEAYDRVRRTFGLSMKIAMVSGLAVTALFALFPEYIVSIFLGRDTNAYQLCARGLPLFSLGFVPMALTLTVIGLFQSVGDAVPAVVLTLLRGIVLPVAAFGILPGLMGNAGLWLAMPSAEFLTALAVLPFLGKLKNCFRKSL